MLVKPEIQLYEESLGRAPGRARLANRRFLVVGAGQQPGPDIDAIGLGRAVAILLAREGAAVACADINAQSAKETAELIGTAGGRSSVIQTDVTDPTQIRRMFDEASGAFGGLDGMVVNVGIIQGTRLADLTPDIWDHEYRVNVRAPMLCCQAALEIMPPGASIALVSSVASFRSTSRAPAYETSKAAVNVLTRTVAMAGEPKGIRCNAVAPGGIDTPLNRAEIRRTPNRARESAFGRQGTPWEVAYATLFLVSNESSYINSQVLIVDGGLTNAITRENAAKAC